MCLISAIVILTVFHLCCSTNTTSLEDLDKKIVKSLLKPVEKPSFRIQLLEDTFKYFCRLDDISERFKSDSFTAIRLLNETGLQEDPKFVGTSYDCKQLAVYGWSQDDLDELENNIRITKHTWRQIQEQLVLSVNATNVVPSVTSLNITTKVKRAKKPIVKKRPRRFRKLERLRRAKEKRKKDADLYHKLLKTIKD